MANAIPGCSAHMLAKPSLVPQDTNQEAGPSGSRTSRQAKANQPQKGKPLKKVSKATEREARHKAIEKAIEKATKEADKMNRRFQSKEPVGS